MVFNMQKISKNRGITLVSLLILFVLLFITFYLNPTILKISNISENKEKLPEGLYDSSFEIIDNDDEKILYSNFI